MLAALVENKRKHLCVWLAIFKHLYKACSHISLEFCVPKIIKIRWYLTELFMKKIRWTFLGHDVFLNFRNTYRPTLI